MRARGITFDTGFIHLDTSTRPHFDPNLVRREMDIIRNDLHCRAVRVTGGDPDRLELAASIGADAGLEVWFSPFICDLTQSELLDFLVDCAVRAERIRQNGAEVVFTTGAELSLFAIGFLPGETLVDRLQLLEHPTALRQAVPAVPAKLNAFLACAVERVRQHFGGKISYAAIPSFEHVDWAPFDLICVDLYRTSAIAGVFRDGVRTLARQGKPVAITEFGCTTYRGAGDRGARGGDIVTYEAATPVRLTGDYVRDESEQAAQLLDQLTIFEEEGVDTVFINTFASYHLPHRLTDDPRDDLDLASYGVVKVLEGGLGQTYPDMPWEPKVAFHAIADAYAAR